MRLRPTGLAASTRPIAGAFAFAFVLTACASELPAASSDGSTGATTANGSAESDGRESDSTGETRADASSESTASTPPPPPTACAEETDISAAPQNIGEAIEFINALPHPVTLNCFLERLERPVPLNATWSTVSLQPADGRRSPRVFLFYGDLIMSVATDGVPGTTLLEFGEFVAPTKSIKGELAFPIEETLDITAPLQHVFDGEGSKCRICHGGEAETPEYDLAFASDALRFRAMEEVELDDLKLEHTQCDATVEPDRCVRLDALFGFGPVVPADFPEGLQTIYDYE